MSHRVLHIAAGGKNERIASFIAEHFNCVPKALLPVDDGELTLIRRIVENGSSFFDAFFVHCSPQNISEIEGALLGVDHSISFTEDGNISFLTPLLLQPDDGSTQFICSCDHFADFSWERFYSWHLKEAVKVSCLVARTRASLKGTKVELDGPMVRDWQPDFDLTQDCITNVGCYIFDCDTDVRQLLGALLPEHDEQVEPELIYLGWLGGYRSDGVAFNINTRDHYLSLIDHLGFQLGSPGRLAKAKPD